MHAPRGARTEKDGISACRFANLPWRKVVVILAAMAALFAPAPIAAAEEITPGEAVARLFTAEEIAEDLFTEAFLAEVSIRQMADLLAALETRHGAFREVTGEGEDLTTRLAMVRVPTQVALDADGRIAGLFFRGPIPVGGDVQSYVDAISALPGNTSVLVTTDGEAVAAHRADAVMAVGSAAKLAILAEAQAQVAAGELAWDTVVCAAPRSVPRRFIPDALAPHRGSERSESPPPRHPRWCAAFREALHPRHPPT